MSNLVSDLPLDAEIFQHQFATLLDTSEQGPVKDFHFIDLPANRAPWLPTGLRLEVGEQLTSIAIGRTYMTPTQELWLEPHFQLWFRIGEHGQIFRGTRYSHTFTVDAPGSLHLASYFPGEWSDRKGGQQIPREAYDMVSGGMRVLLIRWRAAALPGLLQTIERGDVDGLLQLEIQRLQQPVTPPENWDYLWFLGPAEIYRSGETKDKTAAICCRTHQDVGIIHKDAPFPLHADTRLRWSWKVDALPSDRAEDTVPTHDYLSIAVEFDNGQDLTYLWSAELPVGTGFRCPLPTWNARETHVVVRSGTTDFGRWLNEQRNVYDDYRNFVGGDMPGQIVRVWLIAVSLFQRKEGRCEYADIALLNRDERVQVL